ncbi:MAG: tetratricopeptide repeat protein [Thermodesulfobacteriota bacterium]
MINNRYLHFSLLLLLGLIIYSVSFGGPFVYDDNFFILENEHLRSLYNYTYPSGTRFVGFLSFAVNYAVNGYEPFGYKLVNISIHIINSMLVYTLVSLMIRTPVMEGVKTALKALPLISALLFLVHPIETQAVSYITQRFASLATLLYLAALASYMKSRLMGINGDYRGRYLFYAFALIAALIAQKTKEISFTLPVIIVLFEFTFFNIEGKGADIKRRIIRLIPFVLVMAIIPAALYLPDTGHGGELGMSGWLKSHQLRDIEAVSRFDYLMTQFRVIVTYLRLLVLPVDQNLLYDYPKYSSFFALPVVSSFIFLAAIFSASIYLYIRSIRRGWGFGIIISLGLLWFFITISVESSIIPIQHVIFEHRLYLPSIGFFIFAAAVFIYLAGRISGAREGRAELSKGALAIVMIIVTLFSVLSYRRNLVWADELRLWKDVDHKSPGIGRVKDTLGLIYKKLGDREKAREYFREAIRINSKLSNPYNNLGSLYMGDRDYKSAFVLFEKALKYDNENGEAHNNIANVYRVQGDMEQALFHYSEAARLEPSSDEIIFNIAVLNMIIGDMEKAKEGYVEAIRLAPGRGDYHMAFAIFYRKVGDIERAISHFKEAIRLVPDLEDAYINLATIYFSRGSYNEAVWNFKKAEEINPANDDTHFNLAATYRVMGNFTLSKKHYLETIRLRPGSGDAHFQLGLIYANEKRWEEAKEEFSEALRISPGFKAAEIELNRLLKGRNR